MPNHVADPNGGAWRIDKESWMIRSLDGTRASTEYAERTEEIAMGLIGIALLFWFIMPAAVYLVARGVKAFTKERR